MLDTVPDDPGFAFWITVGGPSDVQYPFVGSDTQRRGGAGGFVGCHPGHAGLGFGAVWVHSERRHAFRDDELEPPSLGSKSCALKTCTHSPEWAFCRLGRRSFDIEQAPRTPGIRPGG